MAKHLGMSIHRELFKKSVRETIHEEIQRFLMKIPDRRALVTDVARYVIKATRCKTKTFYAYLSEMESVHKEKIDNRLYCYIETAVTPELSFPRMEEIKDESLRENVHRAIRNLTINNVDMGLLQLGKILESEIRSFLVQAQKRNAFQVTSNDLQRLVSMMDCVARNGIVKNAHHLTLLRQERNERAHGSIPGIDEREEMMRQAPFLAGLFIEYIVFFHSKRSEL